jgi:hypothetical protein
LRGEELWLKEKRRSYTRKIERRRSCGRKKYYNSSAGEEKEVVEVCGVEPLTVSEMKRGLPVFDELAHTIDTHELILPVKGNFFPISGCSYCASWGRRGERLK